MTDYVVYLAIGYFLGSIPSGYLYGRALRGVDIRKFGSGNVGATNAARVLGKHAFVVVFSSDFIKGALPVLIAKWFNMEEAVQVLAGIAAIGGHMVPVFLLFRGGKGVATSAGVFFTLAPMAATASLFVFLVVFSLVRIVSVASISGAVALLAAGLVQYFSDLLGLWTLLAIGWVCLLVIWRHRANIERLRQGTEPRMGSVVENQKG